MTRLVLLAVIVTLAALLVMAAPDPVIAGVWVVLVLAAAGVVVHLIGRDRGRRGL